MTVVGKTWQTRRDDNWDNPQNLETLLSEIDTYLSSVSYFYAMRNEIRARVAELYGRKVALPRRSRQTDFQRGYDEGFNAGRGATVDA